MTEAQINIKIDNTSGQKTVNQLNDSLKETTNQSKSLKSQLREMTNALNQLEPGTAEFQRMAVEAGKLRDQIKDTQAVINATAGSIGENLGGALGKVANVGINAFQGIQGVQAMFGSDSKELMKIMAQLQGAMALSQAIAGFGQLADTIVEVKASIKAAALAFEGFNTATKASVIGLIVAGISAAVAGYTMLTSKTEEQVKAEKELVNQRKFLVQQQKDHSEYIAKESAEFVTLLSRLKNTNTGTKERSDLIKTINGQYGTTLSNLKSEAEFQAAINNELKNYNEYVIAKYNIQKNEKAIIANLEKQDSLNAQIAAREKELSDTISFNIKLAMSMGKSYVDARKDALFYVNNTDKQLINLNIQLNQAKNRFNSYTSTIQKNSAVISDLTNNGEKYVEQTNKTTKATKEQTNSIDEKNKALKEYGDLLGEVNFKEIKDFDKLAEANKKYLKRLTEISSLRDKDKKPFITDEQVKTALDKIDTLYEEAYNTIVGQEAFDSALEKQAKAVTLAEGMLNQWKYETTKDWDKKTNEQKQIILHNTAELEKNVLDKKLKYDLFKNSQNAEERYKIQQEYNLKILEIDKKLQDDMASYRTKKFSETLNDWISKNKEMIDAIANMAMQGQDLVGQYFDELNARTEYRIQQSYDNQLAAYQKLNDNKKISDEQLAQKQAELEQTYNAQKRGQAQKQFRQDKALNIVQATIQGVQATLAAFTQGFKLGGPVGAGIFAGIAAAFSAAQIGIIASQKFRFSKGGIVPGSPSNTDSVSGMLAPGETVINSTSSGLFPELLSAINMIGGGLGLTPDSKVNNVASSQTPMLFQQQMNMSPVRAYVVESDITQTQRRISRFERNNKY